jgi:hypothetical protein
MAMQNHTGTGDNVNAEGNVYINSIPKLTSDLSTVVNALSKKLFFEETTPELAVEDPFTPNQKIEYNNVRQFKSIIDGYKSFWGKLSTIYQEFDRQGTNKKHIVLENIKLAYLKEKTRLIQGNAGKEEIEIIREHADEIIQKVENSLVQQIESSSNIETSKESINISLQIVLIDAFIRCKILEEPK